MSLQFELFIDYRKSLRKLFKILVLFGCLLCFIVLFISIGFQLSYRFLNISVVVSLVILLIFNFFIEDFFYKKCGKLEFLENELKFLKNNVETLVSLSEFEEIIINYIDYKRTFIFFARFYNETGKNNTITLIQNNQKLEYHFLSKELNDEFKLRSILKLWNKKGYRCKYLNKGEEQKL